MRTGNKARDELIRLQQETQKPLKAAEQQAQTLQIKNQVGYPRSLDRDEDGEAEFALPEALATAVGASFILGPIGGLLLGAAQGILGKQEKQGMLDQWNAEQNALTSSAGIVTDQINQLRMSDNLSKFDQDQLNSFEAMVNVGLKQGDPAMIEQGLKGVSEYTVRQEEQMKADELRQAELGQYYDGVYSGMQDDFRTESQPYLSTIRQANKALQAYEKGDAASMYAAGKLFEKSLDPDSVVMAQELEGQGTLGNLWTAVTTKVDKYLGSGLPVPEDLRKEFAGVVDMVARAAEHEQRNIQDRYVNDAQERGIPMKYWDNFDATSQLPRYEIKEFKNPYAGRTAPKEVAEATQEAAGGAFNWLKNAATNDINRLTQFIQGGESEREQRRSRIRELPTN